MRRSEREWRAVGSGLKDARTTGILATAVLAASASALIEAFSPQSCPSEPIKIRCIAAFTPQARAHGLRAH